jgi:hypothetical protein
MVAQELQDASAPPSGVHGPPLLLLPPSLLPPLLLELLLLDPPLLLLLELLLDELSSLGPASIVFVGVAGLLLLLQAAAAAVPATATSTTPVILRRRLWAFITQPRSSQSGKQGLIRCRLRFRLPCMRCTCDRGPPNLQPLRMRSCTRRVVRRTPRGLPPRSG